MQTKTCPEPSEKVLAARWTGDSSARPSENLVTNAKSEDATYHGGHEIQRSHPDADILIIDARKDSVLVFRNQVGMRWDNLYQSEESNVFDCL